MHDESHPTFGTLSRPHEQKADLPSAELPQDLADVVAEVIGQLPRLLALQDRDPDSPMRGCMHQAYWRDKTSDVADMRRQEAALTFAWLWRHPFAGNCYHQDDEVLHASLRALRFWADMQHADGTFDEWYVGEHGYATTAFSSYAVALTVHALGDALPAPLKQRVIPCLRRSADWLTRYHDWFKTNHEAVGVAALAAVGWLLNEDHYKQAASRHAEAIAQRMHAEGWSREISGLDVGYTFLLAEYLGMHAVLNGARDVLPAVVKAYRFAAEFLHPNLTTGAEYGICGNPYFSRVGTVLGAAHDGRAAAALQWMDRPSSVPRDTASTLKDDLRLARYAYQPLLAALLHLGWLPRTDRPASTNAYANREDLLFQRPHDNSWFPAAKLAAVARAGYAAWFAPCYGGFLRIAFRDGSGFLPAVEDRGFAIDRAGKTFRNARYALDVDAAEEHGGLTVDAPLVPCRFVNPPYWARVGLRVATSLPKGHRWSRWLIDRWRKRKGTALNQSAAGFSGGRSPLRLQRRVHFHDQHVELVDRLSCSQGPLDPTTVFAVAGGPLQLPDGRRPDVDRRIPLTEFGATVDASGDLVMTREIRLEQGVPVVRLAGQSLE